MYPSDRPPGAQLLKELKEVVVHASAGDISFSVYPHNVSLNGVYRDYHDGLVAVALRRR